MVSLSCAKKWFKLGFSLASLGFCGEEVEEGEAEAETSDDEEGGAPVVSTKGTGEECAEGVADTLGDAPQTEGEAAPLGGNYVADDAETNGGDAAYADGR